METDFMIHVKTGNRLNAGTNANVFIILKDSLGNKTNKITLDILFRDDLERGSLDSFPVTCPNDFRDNVDEIELWRDEYGFNDSWFAERISIENVKTNETFTFPLQRWIKANYRYKIKLLDTSLPQDDPNYEQRKMELIDKQSLYQITQNFPGGPAQIAEIPDEEKFAFRYNLSIKARMAKLVATAKLHLFFNDSDWERMEDIKNIYSVSDDFDIPGSMNKWKSDEHFGGQRIRSLNHSVIRLCTQIPEKMSVTEDTLRPFLEGRTIQQAFGEKRLFIVDLEILQDIPLQRPEYVLPSPIALFYHNSRNQLMPIAIQLFQEKEAKNPVFLPNDPPNTWLMAKMWYNLADAAYHQSLTHLGFTHFMMEGVAIVSNRQLSPSHPIFRLLAPHFLYLIAINTLGLEVLVSKDGLVDKTMTIGINGMLPLLAKGQSIWRLDTHGTVPVDLKSRGVEMQIYRNVTPSVPRQELEALLDPDVLKGYHFRDDALLLYNAIKDYVSKYVNLYYDKPEKLLNDWEIMHWGHELTLPKESGGCGIKGIPNEGKFETLDDLIITLTSIIYTCSAAHASTNFPQYDEYGYPPNYPLSLYGKPPVDKTPLSDEDILKALPDKTTTLDIMSLTTILSDKGTNSLGDFEVQYIFDPEAMKIVKKFRKELTKITKDIKKRNRNTNDPYIWLDPELVPNSISI